MSEGASDKPLFANEIVCKDDILRRYGSTGFLRGSLSTALLYGLTMFLMIGFSPIGFKGFSANTSNYNLPTEVPMTLTSRLGAEIDVHYALSLFERQDVFNVGYATGFFTASK